MNFQNRIVRGTDTPIIIKFAFKSEFAALGLNNFSRIQIQLEAESYDTDGAMVWIEAADELRANLGDTAVNPGQYYLTITGYSPTYPDGFLLASEQLHNLGLVEVI